MVMCLPLESCSCDEKVMVRLLVIGDMSKETKRIWRLMKLLMDCPIKVATMVGRVLGVIVFSIEKM